METILKFFHNPGSNNNEIISRTLCKIAVISRRWQENYLKQGGDPNGLPKHSEMWRCAITNEAKPGKNQGCFIVEPIERVAEESVVKLLGGVFTVKKVETRGGGTQLIIRPKSEHLGHNWILSLHHKRSLTEEHNAYCAIVDLAPTEITESTGTPTSPVQVHE